MEEKRINMEAGLAAEGNVKPETKVNKEMERAALEKILTELEKRDRMKSLLDMIHARDMSQKDAVTYALGYFEGISDMDAEKEYTAGDIYDLLLALYKTRKSSCKPKSNDFVF